MKYAPNDLFLSISWGQRADELGVSILRARQTFASLAEAGEAFAVWGTKGKSRSAAMSKPVLDLSDAGCIKGLLLSGRVFTDIHPKTVIDDVGQSISLWNREAAGLSATISIRCGSLVTGIGNCVNLNACRIAEGPVIRGGTLVTLLRTFIDIWQPDDGRIVATAVQPQSSDPYASATTLARYGETRENLGTWLRGLLGRGFIDDGNIKVHRGMIDRFQF